MANKDRQQTAANLLVCEPCSDLGGYFPQPGSFGADAQYVLQMDHRGAISLLARKPRDQRGNPVRSAKVPSPTQRGAPIFGSDRPTLAVRWRAKGPPPAHWAQRDNALDHVGQDFID